MSVARCNALAVANSEERALDCKERRKLQPVALDEVRSTVH